MSKRPVFSSAVGLVLGILLGTGVHWYFLLAVMIAFAVIAASFWKEKKYGYLVSRCLLFVGMLILGFFVYQKNEIQYEQCEKQLEDGMQIQIQGTISKRENGTDQTTYQLTHCYANLKTGILPCKSIEVELSKDEYLIGTTLIVTGTIEKWKQAENEGNFDAASYYKSKGVVAKLRNGSVEQNIGKPDRIAEELEKLKQRLKEVYKKSMSVENAGVLTTMTVGDKSLLEEEQKDGYQSAGISHILAISGLHVSLIGMTFYKMLRKCRLSFGQAGILAGAMLYFYGRMTGMGISTKRAVLMFFFCILAAWVGRSYDSLNALGAAAIFLLVKNPFLLWNAGFLLSFFAVAGVVVVALTYEKMWQKRKEKEKNGRKKKGILERIRHTLGSTILVSMCIQLVTAPLTAYFYYEIPVYSVILNAFVLPFVGIVLGTGIVGGILGIFSMRLAKIILLPCQMLLTYYNLICKLNLHLPSAVWITGRPDFKYIVIYYGIILVFVWYSKKKKQIRFLFLEIFCLSLLLVYPKERGFELDVLSVGQGDGIFFRTGDNVCCFVDGGSTDTSQVGTYRILPFLEAKGVREISYWFISHTDEDHISGMKEVLKSGYPVQNLVFSNRMEQDEAFFEIKELAEEQGTKIVFLAAGDSLHTKTAEITCLFPDIDYTAEDKNALSMVLLYEDVGFRGIFTGDISAAEEQYLLEQNEVTEDVFFYKAAHHGSKYSNSSEWLECLSPAVAMISCGKNNRYGHPGEEAVSHMEEAGSKVFYTMESGQITLGMDKKGVWIKEYRGKGNTIGY
ncbi:MAG: DNA internalization-related competence protein ComEC/Rec2 [Roseburia sp.]